MKRILIGTTLAAFALAPAMGWADCEYHASMASSKSADKAPLAQAPAASTVPAPVLAKAPVTKQVKHAGDKATSSSPTAKESAVLAKNN